MPDILKSVKQKKQDIAKICKNYVTGFLWKKRTKYKVSCQHDVPLAINVVYEDIFGYKTNGFFVEVGAFDGETASFTSHLADIGWTGRYVEPIKKYFLQCAKRHQNNKVICYNYFIGQVTGKSTMHDYGPFSRKDPIANPPPITEKGETVDIDCLTMDLFLKNNNIPRQFDLLLIDVEDGELNVLTSFLTLGKEFCPTAIIIETENSDQVNKIMTKAGYVRYCSFPTDSLVCTNDLFVSVERANKKFPFLGKLKKQQLIRLSEIIT